MPRSNRLRVGVGVNGNIMQPACQKLSSRDPTTVVPTPHNKAPWNGTCCSRTRAAHRRPTQRQLALDVLPRSVWSDVLKHAPASTESLSRDRRWQPPNKASKALGLVLGVCKPEPSNPSASEDDLEPVFSACLRKQTGWKALACKRRAPVQAPSKPSSVAANACRTTGSLCLQAHV